MHPTLLAGLLVLGAGLATDAAPPSLTTTAIEGIVHRALVRATGRGTESAWEIQARMPLRRRPRARGPEELSVPDLGMIRFPSTANSPLRVIMGCCTVTLDEVQGMFEVVRAVGEDGPVPPAEELKLHLILSDARSLDGLDATLEDLDRYLEINPYLRSDDIWMQDWGELAALRRPGAAREEFVMVDSRRGGALAQAPAILAQLWAGVHLVPPDLPPDDRGNFGGNIEPTPNDLLVVGSTASPEMRSFLASCGYADRLVVLDTGWLDVGHVDELIAFLPLPASPLGFAVAVADPRRGLEVLRGLDPLAIRRELDGMVEAAYLRYPLLPESFDFEDEEALDGMVHKVGSLWSRLAGEPTGQTTEAAALEAVNLEAAQRIEESLDDLRRELQARHGASVPVPVIRLPALYEPGPEDGGARALVPAMANLVVLRRHLAVPDPLLPAFRETAASELAAAGFRVHMVPGLTLHVLQGELHCGTNVLRHPGRFLHPRYELQVLRRLAERTRP